MNEAAKREDDYNYYPDLPVGEILKRTRLHYGQSLADVETVLRIRASQLEAIESGHPDKLPGRVYAIGFVRSYSEYLGLDGNKMVQLFKVQSLGGRERPELHFPVPASESKIPGFWVVAASIAGIIVIGIIWTMIGGSGQKQVNRIPAVPPDLQVENGEVPEIEFSPAIIGGEFAADGAVDISEGEEFESAAQDDETAADAEINPQPEKQEDLGQAPLPAESEHRVTIEVSERSWVEIRDRSGKIILSRTLEPGNTYFVPTDREDLILTTGNAGGLIIKVDGEKIPPFGGRGDVKRNIPLKAEELKKLISG